MFEPSITIRRSALVVLAMVALTLSIVPGLVTRSTLLYAQTSPTETPTVTVTPTWTPTDGTPTATATKSMRVVNEITHPKEGDSVAGIVPIIGTALMHGYLKYDVHVSPAGLDSWQWLGSSFDIVREDAIYRWDTSTIPDGLYDVRVRVSRLDGGSSDAFLRTIEVRNANPPTPTPVLNAAGTPIPQTVSPLPTPTPIVDTSSRVPGGQGFYGPENGATVSGAVNVVGTANGKPEKPFARYELSIAPAGGQNWTLLHSSEEQFWQDTIYVLDTTQLPDGTYDLRLRIVYRDSNYDEYYLRDLRVANREAPASTLPTVGLRAPADDESVSGTVDVIGTTNAPEFLRWELYLTPSGRERWSFLVSGDRPVVNGTIARLDLGQLPTGLYDLRLRLVRSDYNYSEHFARRLRVENDAVEPSP